MSEKPQPVAWMIEDRLVDGGTELKMPVLTEEGDMRRYAKDNPRLTLASLYSEASLSLARNLGLDEAATWHQQRADALDAIITKRKRQGYWVSDEQKDQLRFHREAAAAIRARKTE